ncbi:hypothetical protein EKO04_008444 [Ascochyta lentis]|uniref:Uncharacterized protein n=1 Tax=Ascochyta lentis TaxID=205686 RepID=A0A8H7IZB9_9PLEO|nr:hypothetical protein EKO04_008444 [Ascochyta lentis]
MLSFLRTFFSCGFPSASSPAPPPMPPRPRTGPRPVPAVAALLPRPQTEIVPGVLLVRRSAAGHPVPTNMQPVFAPEPVRE